MCVQGTGCGTPVPSLTYSVLPSPVNSVMMRSSSPLRTRSARKCYPCPRNNLLPM